MPNTRPRVSVVIPTYNYEIYIAEAVESVLAQTYQDFELIVVDDGSTDNTHSVLEPYLDRITYLYQENQGRSLARNRGIQVAQGEYIAFLDADDWFLPHKLELQTHFLDEHPEAGMVAGGWVETDEQGKTLRRGEPWHWKPHLGLAECVMGVPVTPSTVQVRRCWLDAVGLFDESLDWNEDQDLYLRLVADGCRFVWLPEIVSCHRVRKNHMSQYMSHMREDTLAVLDKFYARPDVPEDVRAMQGSAYAAAHVGCAARAYGARAVGEARQDVSRAIELDPGLLQGNPSRLVNLLVGWSVSRVVGDEAEYLDTLARHLPSQVRWARWQVRKAVANRYMGQVFEAHCLGDWETVRTYLVRGLRLDPTWLCNRGVLSITARTFVPILRQCKISEEATES